jgi:hypothetical protein
MAHLSERDDTDTPAALSQGIWRGRSLSRIAIWRSS